MRDIIEMRSDSESDYDLHGDDEISVVPQVELTVPKTDDPTSPTVTFRMWVLGITACAGPTFSDAPSKTFVKRDLHVMYF
ncbi:unnamed protein product [Eruca vesicaria subsp. sativa]|uniref:Uncharacterized protein n=1 Tax=Eruca vesicaria subsp. sativa TaxID=29727 RepID=A0ABC8L123_ERUVS|nr:unnamed protein product [Eruca vesicaria subsp. sativa]